MGQAGSLPHERPTLPPHRVILDTDIGGDIDDAFALALLLRCPEVELAEVVTCCGDVLARVHVAGALLAAAGSPAGLCYGSHNALASRPYPGPTSLTYGLIGEDDGPDHNRTCSPFDLALPDLLLSIGSLTNTAFRVEAERKRWFSRRRLGSRRLIAMTGEFEQPEYVDFNTRLDPEAAHLVFGSGVPIDVISESVGAKVTLGDGDIARLQRAADAGDLLVGKLLEFCHQFWRHEPGKAIMYDPMTVVALLHPEWFDWRQGRVTVELRDESLYGLTRFEEDPAGPHRVAFDVEADLAREFLLSRLCRDRGGGGGGGGSRGCDSRRGRG